jgi:hypothetical protein
MMNLAVSTNPASVFLPPAPPHSEQGDVALSLDHSEQGEVGAQASSTAPPHSEQGDLAVGRIGTAGMRGAQAALLAGARGGDGRAGNAAGARGWAADARGALLGMGASKAVNALGLSGDRAGVGALL